MLTKIMKDLLRLQSILIRDHSMKKLNGSKHGMDDDTYNYFQQELNDVHVMITCIEYIIENKMSMTQFCIKYNLSIANFFFRIKNAGIKFEEYELKNLRSNKIIN